MDVEEIRKLAQNKIEAEALTKEVRDKIKTTIWKKQNLREGFKETFKPLIESQDKVKESIDTKQDAMIKQLQANQLAITDGLNQNRLAITEEFDKMDEVKSWDLKQLPSFEAIEEPQDKSEDEDEDEENSDTKKNRYNKIKYRKNFHDDDRVILKKSDYPRPNYFLIIILQYYLKF